MEADLVHVASHDHPLFREDNAEAYYLLEEATRGTQHAASLKPCQRAKDGRSACFSIRNQCAGRDKWETELKKQDNLLHTCTWKGQSNFSLEKFIAQHRNAFMSVQQCAGHVAFQLPDEFTRVGYLSDAVESADAGSQAAIAQVRTDDAAGGKRNDFEAAASHLPPYDPVAKKRAAGTKRERQVTMSDVTTEIGATEGFGGKPGVGKTGVHLRHHNTQEHKELMKAQ